jgi:hypothetical protein
MGVVPDTRHTTLILFSLADDGTLEALRLPVIAWAIKDCADVKPICAYDWERRPESVACVESEGSWVFPPDVVRGTLEEAETYAQQSIMRAKTMSEPGGTA